MQPSGGREHRIPEQGAEEGGAGSSTALAPLKTTNPHHTSFKLFTFFHGRCNDAGVIIFASLEVFQNLFLQRRQPPNCLILSYEILLTKEPQFKKINEKKNVIVACRSIDFHCFCESIKRTNALNIDISSGRKTE